ncbi:MAG: hypothetical protein NC098_00470 [Lachnoclostridium sp.]|nr:hypothetical protein [Lachnoclostridium sp.]
MKKSLIALLMLMLLLPMASAATQEFKSADRNYAEKASSAMFHVIELTPDRYEYLYDVTFEVRKSGKSITIENVGRSNMYEVIRTSGSMTRKEFRCREVNTGEDVTIVISVEQNPEARNANIYRFSIDKYPGKDPSRQLIDGQISLTYPTGVGYAYCLFDKGLGNPLEKWRAGSMQLFFDFVNARF